MGHFSSVEAKKNALQCLNCHWFMAILFPFCWLVAKLFDLLFGSLGRMVII